MPHQTKSRENPGALSSALDKDEALAVARRRFLVYNRVAGKPGMLALSGLYNIIRKEENNNG